MNVRNNVAEFKRLDKRIVEADADVEAAKWNQARLAWEACKEGGILKKDYASQVNHSAAHIGMLVKVWELRGSLARRFTDAYESAKSGRETTQAAESKRKKERQVPTQHEDKVEMVRKLMSDPAVVDEALDDPVVRHRTKTVVDEDEKKRAARRKKAASQAEADPAGKVIRDAISKMDTYARDLDLIAEAWVVALEDVPVELRTKLAKAAGRLEASAHRVVNATEGRRSLKVVGE